MATEPKNLDVTTTQNALTEPGGETPKTFTQEDVNRIVANRVAKYHDYEELKEKAARYDEAEEASKSELQKAQEKATALQSEIDTMKKVASIQTMRNEVSQTTGVPAELLTGETKEDCEAQAAAINAYAKPTGYPNVKDGGEPHKATQKKSNRDLFADWMNGN